MCWPMQQRRHCTFKADIAKEKVVDERIHMAIRQRCFSIATIYKYVACVQNSLRL